MKLNEGNTVLETRAWGTEEIQSRIQECKDGRLPVPPPGKRDSEFMLSWPAALDGTSPAYALLGKVRALPGHASSSTEWLGRILARAVRGPGRAIGWEGCATRRAWKETHIFMTVPHYMAIALRKLADPG